MKSGGVRCWENSIPNGSRSSIPGDHICYEVMACKAVLEDGFCILFFKRRWLDSGYDILSSQEEYI
jgi:hypothetical protein